MTAPRIVFVPGLNPKPRPELSKYAPRIITMMIKVGD